VAASIPEDYSTLSEDVTGLKSALDNINAVVGIPETAEKTVSVTGTAVNQQDTEMPFVANIGETISIELSGTSMQSTTNSTLYLSYTDDTYDTVNITSLGHKYTKTLQKNLFKISFYIANLTSGSLLIRGEVIANSGLITDVTNLQNEKAEIGLKELSGTFVQRAPGRIIGATGEVVDKSYFTHAIINVVGFSSIEFVSATQGLSSTHGYAFYDENGMHISGSGITDTDIKTSIDIPQNAVTFKYGFYNSLWSDSKYTTFTLINTNNTIVGLQEQIDLITGTGSKVVCFGDSLTQGNQDGTGNTYPKYLGTLIGSSVYNAGVGGEDSLQIASRQGGIALMVEPFTIPAATTPVSVTLSCLEHSYTEPFYIISQANGGINPVEIAGVVGTLTFTGNWATQTYTYTFTRNTAGDSVTLTRPTPIITATSKMRGRVQIFWVGTNDYPHNLQTVQEKIVPRIDAMIAWTNAKNYLVIGLTAKVRFADLADCNTYMQRHFGTRFIDISRYILQYGLQDESITPTAQDNTDIANGEIPTSLRTDSVHLNRYGYDIVAKQVYKRGQLLGYWE
jgi:lysophospholipase L1-like esterase